MEIKTLRKRGGEMYAYLIGTIIGLLVIGGSFYAYNTNKINTSNVQIYTALENLDTQKLSTTRLNNKHSIKSDEVVIIKRANISSITSGLTDGNNYLYVVVSNDTPLTTPGINPMSELSSIDVDKVLSKGIILGNTNGDRIPRYFNNPTIDGDFTIYETRDTSIFASNSEIGENIYGINWILGDGNNIGDTGELFVNIGGVDYLYSIKKMPDNKIWTTQNMRHIVENCDTNAFNNSFPYNSCSFYDNNLDYHMDGLLYQWDLVEIACNSLGSGWSLPTDNEYNLLEFSLGCTDFDDEGARCDGLGGNGTMWGGLISGFSGRRETDGSFTYRGDFGWHNMWTSTEEGLGNEYAWYHSTGWNDTTIYRHYSTKDHSLPIVCVKN